MILRGVAMAVFLLAAGPSAFAARTPALARPMPGCPAGGISRVADVSVTCCDGLPCHRPLSVEPMPAPRRRLHT